MAKLSAFRSYSCVRNRKPVKEFDTIGKKKRSLWGQNPTCGFFLNWCLHSHGACQSMVWFLGRHERRRVQLACGQESGGVNRTAHKAEPQSSFQSFVQSLPLPFASMSKVCCPISAPPSNCPVNSNVIKKYLCV